MAGECANWIVNFSNISHNWMKIQVDDKSRRWKINWSHQIWLESKNYICMLIKEIGVERSWRDCGYINHVQIQSIFEKSQSNDFFFVFLFLQLTASVYLIVSGHVYTFLTESRSSGMDNVWDNLVFHTHCHCH